MVGGTSVKRVPLPDSASGVAEHKRELGMKRHVVPVLGSMAEVVAKSHRSKYDKTGPNQIVVRKMGRNLASKGREKETGQYGTSSRAVALKECKTKTGDAAKSCIRDAFGRAPKAFKMG